MLKDKVFVQSVKNTFTYLIIQVPIMLGIALLLAYIAVAPPQSGTAMAAIRVVLTGLAGHLAVVIPLFLGWIATLSRGTHWTGPHDKTDV